MSKHEHEWIDVTRLSHTVHKYECCKCGAEKEEPMEESRFGIENEYESQKGGDI